jgi:hypothetical protein
MPRFRIYMESPDLTREDGSPHIRVTTGVFDDEKAARTHCERQEMRIAAHEYPEAELAELEAAESEAHDNDVQPSSMVRMRLATHRQTKPYEIVSVEEVV